jgi:hypothetical protein
MDSLNELLAQMKSHWCNPRSAIHRGAEIPFKLRCSLNAGAEEHQLSSIKENLPQEVKDFYVMADGAILFKDDEYGQWGLKLYSLDEITGATNLYLDERSRDSLEGDLIIGEFVGDSDLLLLRCDHNTNDFGSVVVVSAIDPRADWEVASTDFVSFLQELYSHQGDKYWELMQ